MGSFKTAVKVTAGVLLTTGVLIGGCTALGIGAIDNAVKETEKTEVKTDSGSKKVSKENLLTQENYDKVNQGDTLTGEGGSTEEKVLALFGKPDSESETQVGEYKTKLLSWTSLKNGSSVSISITNGKVSNKSKAKF